MRTGFAALASVGVLASMAAPAAAQDYVPITKSAKPGGVAPGTINKSGGVVSAGVVEDPYVCTTPPVLADLQTKIVSTSMSSSAAVKLGLPVGGLEGNANARVLVQDWTRSKPCLSVDGKTTLLYGQGIRIVSTISELDSKTDLSLATIAAQATLNNKSSSIQAVVIGLPDASVQSLAASLLGPLTVENFATKSGIAEALAQKAIASPTGTVGLIGVIPTAPDLSTHVASAFAIQQVSDRKTCLDAKGRFPNADTEQLVAIESIYLAVAGACNASQPGPVAKATAQEALRGIKVK